MPPRSGADRSLRYSAPRPLRIVLHALEILAPPVAARAAGWIICRPRRRRPRPEERKILDRAVRREFRCGRQIVVGHEWGEGPRVLLHHGWSGDGAQMAPIADTLAGAGFRVTVLDARAHGQSPGRQATLAWMAADLVSIARELGDVKAVVGHSMGGMIAARALQTGLDARCIVMISVPAEAAPYTRFFGRVFELRDRTLEDMTTWLSGRTGLSANDATATALSAGQTTPLLLLHDQEDPDVPLRHPEAWLAAWPGAQLELSSGLGHRRILRDAGIAQRVAEFIRLA